MQGDRRVRAISAVQSRGTTRDLASTIRPEVPRACTSVARSTPWNGLAIVFRDLIDEATIANCGNVTIAYKTPNYTNFKSRRFDEFKRPLSLRRRASGGTTVGAE